MCLFHCPAHGQLLHHVHLQHCEWVSFEQPLRMAVASKTKLRGLSPRANCTKCPPLVCRVSANVCKWRVLRGQHSGSLQPYSRISRPEPLLFLPSSSSVILTRLSGHRSRHTAAQKIW
jgi:hypothetical protein